jgi:ribosomal protein S18 acetylase RimI-like enzyme
MGGDFMELIEANESHFQELTEMWGRFMHKHAEYDPYFRLKPGALEGYDWYLRMMTESQNAAIFIIIEDNRIAGRIFCEIDEYPPIYRYDKYGWIVEIEVLEEHRQRGWGRLLIEKAYQWLASKGIRRVELEVAPGNTGAIAFWKKLNFVDVFHKMYHDI